MHAYGRQTYEIADGRYTPMGEARIWEMHACEIHAYKIAYGRGVPMSNTPIGWLLWEAGLWETRLWDGGLWETRLWDDLWERHAYEMHAERCTPMRNARLWEVHAYERCTPMRDARLWEMHLWDDFCEKHADERHAYEMAAYERHVYEMALVRDMPMRDAPMRNTPMRWPMEDARLWETSLWDGWWGIHAYGRDTPMGEARLLERHAYGMA
jgi:hypothetical protein